MLKFGSSPFASDPSGQLNVLGHDGHPLGVDSLQAEFKKQQFFLQSKVLGTYTKVGVLKQADKISFAGFLQCHDSRALKPQVGLEVLSDLANQALEGELANEQLRRFLVPGELKFNIKEFKSSISILVPTF